MNRVAPPLRWPAGIDAEIFLRDYWQKRPLLMRNALPGFTSPLDPDELAGLACEPDVESRLVIEAGDPPWQVKHGPFEEDDFGGLPADGWSLLVQDVDKHLPELAVIADRFDFIPSWRFDDLMVSHAPPGGSVGAHLDAYDVFLVQGAGQRTWSIGPRPAAPQWKAGAQLRLLTNFAAQSTWTLSPGDALYLPPGVAHHGIAGAGCMTWSVGFRAPSHQQLVAAAGAVALHEPPDDAMYEDADLQLDEAASGLISAQAVERATHIVRHYCGGDAADRTAWFGELVTEPKEWLRAEPQAIAGDASALVSVLRKGGVLQRHGMALLARSCDGTTLFADGESFALPAALSRFA